MCVAVFCVDVLSLGQLGPEVDGLCSQETIDHPFYQRFILNSVQSALCYGQHDLFNIRYFKNCAEKRALQRYFCIFMHYINGCQHYNRFLSSCLA